jgi:hypothetical protein
MTDVPLAIPTSQQAAAPACRNCGAMAIGTYCPNCGQETSLVVWAIVYLLRSMKVVYGGRWTGVVVRALVIFVEYSVFYGIAVAGLVVAAILLR